MADIVLHQWVISPFCNKVRKILEHKGLRYSTVEYNGLRSRDAARLSKVGKLPVIDCDGERIQDSAEIARFLEDRFPEPAIYPSEPAARAQACMWEDWAGEALFWFEVHYRVNDPEAAEAASRHLTDGRPAWERFAMSVAFRRIYGGRLKAQGLGRMPRAGVDERFERHLTNLDAALAPKGWLVGDCKSIADISVAAQLEEILRTSRSLRPRVLAHPRIADWLDRMSPGHRDLV